MKNIIRKAGENLDRRSFFRGLGKWGMGAAAVTGVLVLNKKASAQGTCNNNGGNDTSCHDRPVGYIGCGKNQDGICVANSSGHCNCVRP